MNLKEELDEEWRQHRINLQRIRNRERWMKTSIVLLPLLMILVTFLVMKCQQS